MSKSGNWGPHGRYDFEYLGWIAAVVHITDPRSDRADWKAIQQVIAEIASKRVPVQNIFENGFATNGRRFIHPLMLRLKSIEDLLSSSQTGATWIAKSRGGHEKYDPRDDGLVVRKVLSNIDRPLDDRELQRQIEARFMVARAQDQTHVRIVHRAWKMLRAARVLRGQNVHRARAWFETVDAFTALMILGRADAAYKLVQARTHGSWSAEAA